MFAFLKTIFGSRPASSRGAAGLAMPRTVYTSATRPAPARQPVPTSTPRPQPRPVPAPRPAPVLAHDEDSATGSDVDIPLSSVLRGLPPDLKHCVRDLDIRGATMTISLERILAQLPSGSVKISFGSLRQAAPQLFSIGPECDVRDVALPLDEILSRINPAMVCPPKHPVQRGPIEEAPTSSSDTDTFTPTTRPQTQPRNSTLSVPPNKSKADEIPDLFFDARKDEGPKTNGGEEEAPIPRRSRSLTPQTAALEPAAVTPAAPTSVAKAWAAQSTQPEPVVLAQPPRDAAVMRIPLKDLTQLWPEELRSEIGTLAPSHIVALPSEAINAGLKQGKVTFPWGSLRSWITPELPSLAFRDDKATLELPLPVIMPLFLAGRKEPSRPQLQVLDDDIPDPFADFIQPPATAQKNGKPQAEPEKPAPKEKAPDTKTFARQAKPASPKTEAKVESKAEPAAELPKQSATPAEVLASALKLQGIAGALVALADGFKVASKLPPGLDGDAVAAFLPHIFSKVNQSTRELRMGELDNLNFTVDNVPWKIFRVNQIFFAALGTAGQQMPTDQLVALAHQLTFKN